MAGLPLLKLSGLLVKTVAKPVAARMKIEATKHPNFLKWVLFTGQSAHAISSRLTVMASGYKFMNVKPLPQEEALSKGINFLSEAFVFCIAGGIITFEYTRAEINNREKAVKAAEKEAGEKRLLDEKFAEIDHRLRDIEGVLSKDKRLSVELQRQKRLEGATEYTDQPPVDSTVSKYLGWIWHTAMKGLDNDLIAKQVLSHKEEVEENVKDKKTDSTATTAATTTTTTTTTDSKKSDSSKTPSIEVKKK